MVRVLGCNGLFQYQYHSSMLCYALVRNPLISNFGKKIKIRRWGTVVVNSFTSSPTNKNPNPTQLLKNIILISYSSNLYKIWVSQNLQIPVPVSQNWQTPVPVSQNWQIPVPVSSPFCTYIQILQYTSTILTVGWVDFLIQTS